MLTNKQKNMIVKQLVDAYDDFDDFIDSIEDAGKRILNDMFGKDHQKIADRIAKYSYAHDFQSSIYDRCDTSRSGKAIADKHCCSSNASIKDVSATVYLQHDDPKASNGTGFQIRWYWTDADELRSGHSGLPWIMGHVMGETSGLSIENFVYKHADTNPEKIIRLKNFLKTEATDELAQYFSRLINAYCTGIANAIEKTNEKEAMFDNMLLSEFNLSTAPAKVKRYSYTFKITKKEVEK